MMGQSIVDLLGGSIEQSNIIRCPASVEFFKADIQMTFDRNKRSVGIDECDYGPDQGIVDVREIGIEKLQSQVVLLNQYFACKVSFRRTGTVALTSLKRTSRSMLTIL